MVDKVISEITSASVPNPRLAEESYREALASSEETLGVANATRFKVHVQPMQSYAVQIQVILFSLS